MQLAMHHSSPVTLINMTQFTKMTIFDPQMAPNGEK
jgi:hypothetical protein